MVHSYILTHSVIKGTKDVEQLENSGPLRASTCKLFRSFCKTRQITMAQWQLLLFNETEISGPVFCNLTKDLVSKETLVSGRDGGGRGWGREGVGK